MIPEKHVHVRASRFAFRLLFISLTSIRKSKSSKEDRNEKKNTSEFCRLHKIIANRRIWTFSISRLFSELIPFSIATSEKSKKITKI